MLPSPDLPSRKESDDRLSAGLSASNIAFLLDGAASVCSAVGKSNVR